jgi:DNA-binding NtrC family response regulator
MTEQKISALLVCGSKDHLFSLRQILDQAVWVAGSCEEAAHYFQKPNPPHLVFTDTAIADGSWRDVVHLAAKASRPINVIVVACEADTRLSIEAKKQGAFDFISTSSLVPEAANVVRNAAQDVVERRQAQERLSSEPGAPPQRRRPLLRGRR